MWKRLPESEHVILLHCCITLPVRHQQPLERIMREIRRRTRVVGAFPDGQSCLNLAAARLRYIVGTA
jgi:transposase-like protein